MVVRSVVVRVENWVALMVACLAAVLVAYLVVLLAVPKGANLAELTADVWVAWRVELLAERTATQMAGLKAAWRA